MEIQSNVNRIKSRPQRPPLRPEDVRRLREELRMRMAIRRRREAARRREYWK